VEIIGYFAPDETSATTGSQLLALLIGFDILCVVRETFSDQHAFEDGLDTDDLWFVQ